MFEWVWIWLLVFDGMLTVKWVSAMTYISTSCVFPMFCEWVTSGHPPSVQNVSKIGCKMHMVFR